MAAKNNNLDIENILQSQDQEAIMRALAEVLEENEHDPDAVQELLSFLHPDAPTQIEQRLERIHPIVPVEQFIHDDYFLGIPEENVFPEVMKAAREIIGGGYVEALLMGAIGIGKTTLAQIVQAYYLYDLSTLVNPQAKFGLMPTSSIVFVMLNRTDELARSVTFGEFRQLIEDRPYFKEEFSFPREQKGKMEFPRNIKVLPAAAYSNKLLGMNIIGGIIDEMNFMSVVEKSKKAKDGEEFNQAVTIYNTLVRRRKSRFENNGRLPGCLCVVSSKGGPDDFTEKRKQKVEAEETDQLTYIWEKKQWDVLPPERFSEQKFIIEIGDERHNSRIIPDATIARDGSQLLDVPANLKSTFEDDMEGALRDFAGISTLSRRPFFYDREKIWMMAENFEKNEMECPFEGPLESDLSLGLPRVKPTFQPKFPEKMRVAHVDLGLTSDACGIAVGYVHSVVTIKSRGTEGQIVVEDMPLVVYDVVYRVTPQSGREIDFDEIRQIIYSLRDDAHLPIRVVTYDNFQSVDSRQLLAKKGFATGHMSVDGKDGREIYRAFRQAVHAERIWAPEHYTAFVELSKLEENHEKKLVDHPTKGSKDTADAMAGVFATLMKHRASWAGMGARERPEMTRPKTHSSPRPVGIRRPVTVNRPEGR